MVIIGFSETLSLAQSIGIVGTMVLTLFFSKRQIQALSTDTETRVVNDPSIGRVIENINKYTNQKEVAFSFYVLWMCAHAYATRQRKVLDDNEWAGWLQWMRNSFRKGTISEVWKQIEPDGWFNPAFQKFINTEIATGNR